MKTRSPFLRLGALALFGALAWAAFPSAGSAMPPDFHAVAASPAAFLHNSGSATFASRTQEVRSHRDEDFSGIDSCRGVLRDRVHRRHIRL